MDELMKNRIKERSKLLKEQMEKRILILDGAMGTMLQQANLQIEDFGKEGYEGCNEILNLTRPDLIKNIHEAYLLAGADIIETNTFGGTRIVLNEYGLAEKVNEINYEGARIAKEIALQYSTEDEPRFVAGSMGPTTKMLSLTGGVTFDEMVDAYYEQAKALILGGIDLLLLETAQDTLNVKAAGIGIKKVFDELGVELPLMISGTIETIGTTLAGQNVEAFYLSLEHLNPISIGINCATGPEHMREHIRTLSELTTTKVSIYPNAGMPDEEGVYHESPVSFAQKLTDYAQNGWLNIAGGCCGTTPEHIKELAKSLKNIKPRLAPIEHLPAITGIEPVYVEKENRPLLVGERTNVIGSKKFRDLIAEEKYEEAAEIAYLQVKNGAQIIDVCLANPDRNELNDMLKFLPKVTKKVKVPIMIDSTDSIVIEQSLKFLQGKGIINSINLEEGEKRFREVIPLIKKFGAKIVVGTIDERGMGITLEQKLEIAKRSYSLLVDKYEVKPEDIIFDPLVFPIGTGDINYYQAATATIKAITEIKKLFPKVGIILGISNLSFGLPPAGREVLNSIFLYQATKAGLDYAIVNTEKLKRYANISREERELAENLLLDNSEVILTDFINYFRNLRKDENKKEEVINSLEDRLKNYIIEGLKNGLTNDLASALEKYQPLEIINGPLMQGMEEVGKLFNDNKLIVAEVLQSAEVMKAAVDYLKPYLSKSSDSKKGKIILATVKGDVHDIGKNLVEIILSNNGYEVINLGIKVPSEAIINAYYEEKADAIGLSGLLVRSAQQMVATAQDLRVAGINVPLIVGGAALTKKFTETKISPEYNGKTLYAKDAMHGLELLNNLLQNRNNTFENNIREFPIEFIKEKVEQPQKLEKEKITELSEIRDEDIEKEIINSPIVSKVEKILTPKDIKRHLLLDYPLSELYQYLNLRMLLGKHLGLKGDVYKLLEIKDEKALKLYQNLRDFMEKVEVERLIVANGVYRFFPVQKEGNKIFIFNPDKQEEILTTFTFPRQKSYPYLSLADYLANKEEKKYDYLGMFVVSTGEGVREKARILVEEGKYVEAIMLQTLALELAEAFAEKVHHLMREELGIFDPDNMTMEERFQGKYQGARFSFGYPACPNIEDQEKLFKLLKPEEIGVYLTEGYMMEPEASVSAIVISHPEARYFSV